MSGSSVPIVATNTSQAQGLAPVNPPLSAAGRKAAAIINATNAAAHRTYKSLFTVIEDYPNYQQRAADGGPMPVVDPVITLAAQTGSVATAQNVGAVISDNDLTITTADAETSEMRYAALQDSTASALTKESIAAMSAPVGSASLQAAIDVATISKAA